MFSLLKKIDWVLVFCLFFLVVFGLLSIYSSSPGSNFEKQIIFLGIGTILMSLFIFIDWRAVQSNSYLILALYFFSLLALAGLFFLAPVTRGVKGWYKLGPISLDPISLTKIILIILLAKYFSKRHTELYSLKYIILSGVYMLLPTLLIIFQPDMGSALIIASLWTGILIISGIRIREFLILTFLGLALVLFSWTFVLEDYQRDRVVSFLAPEMDPQGLNWNQRQAKIAIGSGGLFGKGFNKGSQARYGFLPEAHTDFVFASIAEEYGLLGVFILLILFLVLIWRIIRIALRSESNFPRLFSSGVVIILVFQLFIHIGMNLGLLPVIGVSLPLVSYGGSELIMFFIALGIVQSIKVNS